jgi:hypothetical protein
MQTNIFTSTGETSIAGSPIPRHSLEVLEPYSMKVASTVLRGRKLPGAARQKDTPATQFGVIKSY